MKMESLIKSALLLLAMIVPATAVAYDSEVDGIYYNSNGSSLVTKEMRYNH